MSTQHNHCIFKVSEQIPCGWDADNKPNNYYTNVFMLDEAKFEDFAREYPFEYQSLELILYNVVHSALKIPKFGFVGTMPAKYSLTDSENIYRKLEPESRSGREIRSVIYFVRH